MDFRRLFGVMAAAVLLYTGTAEAGVFNIPRFIPTDSYAIGFEPEVNLTHGAGIGANVKFAYGLNDLMNATAILGTGTGPRRFRVGANVVFDFFPDIESQPGIGLAAQAIYYRKPNEGQLDVTGIPYIHKAFLVGANEQEVEPFVGIPFGFAFSGGEYKVTSTFAFGAMFKSTEHFRYVTEFGIQINHAESYISGGVIYYP